MQKNIAASLFLFLFLPLALLGLPGQALAGKIRPEQALAGPAGQESLLLTVTTGQGFSLTAGISGEVSYFAGQTNLAGRQIPLDKKRFLAGELIRFELDFNSWPACFKIDLAGQTYQYNGIKGRTNYVLTLPLAGLEQTLDWAGKRLKPAWTLSIDAWSGADPQQHLSCQFTGLELTGDVWELVRVQPVRP